VPQVSWESKTWPELSADDVFAVMKLRTDVFFLEQRITEEELDHHDRAPDTQHIWAHTPEGEAVAYVRVVVQDPPPAGDLGIGVSIGRLVVDAHWRGRGLGHELMRLALAHGGDGDIILHAQSWVARLYAAHGFETVGEEFVEAGIVHVRMVRRGARGES
jgi:ElaA protein